LIARGSMFLLTIFVGISKGQTGANHCSGVYGLFQLFTDQASKLSGRQRVRRGLFPFERPPAVKSESILAMVRTICHTPLLPAVFRIQ
jgi:hypothetical protein